ncbi:MAG TPA: metallophosphoesterase family protein [Candidatus Limnocylindrales bacterium]|nr:metallophosphoesterase family protein [Candidatus Limnocylindrales bacterium]
MIAPVLASTQRASDRPPPYRYLFHTGSNQQGAVRLGFNLLDVDAKEEADSLPPGVRGLYWLGGYVNAPTCNWEEPDALVAAKVRAAKGDRKIWGYYFSNEPDPYGCPTAIAQHRARARLIKSIDPHAATYVSLDMNWREQALAQLSGWRGVADYVGLNPYICFRGRGTCDFAWLDRVIAAADRAGIAYFGHVQAFQADEWRWPSPAELAAMLDRWAQSRQRGYAVFTWSWGGSVLLDRPQLVRVLERYNGRRPSAAATRPGGTASEIHYSFAAPTGVVFEWKGTATTIRYGRTTRYGTRVVAGRPTPVPFSSAGPFHEARLARLRPGTTYHYSIGGGPDRTFGTAPTGRLRFVVEGDVGDSQSTPDVAATQAQIAAERPAFVIVAGDLTYGNDNGQAAVDRHFDDVMAWSRSAAYMPAWGNHEWDSPEDDLRNYKGRFAIPHAQASPGAPAAGCCGEDWGWFDAGGVRFISYPEPYEDATWSDWQARAARLMAAAQRDPKLNFIVTYGHRPAYSSGYHDGDTMLAAILDSFGDRYRKYVLNFNAHSHDYERFVAIHGVVHVTSAGGGAPLEAPWRRDDPRTAFRIMHLEHVRVDVTPTRMRLQAVCGPATSEDEDSCPLGRVIDSVMIARR